MGRGYRYIALIPALLFVARIGDVANNIEYSSGFFISQNYIYHIAQLAVIIVAAAVLSRVFRAREPKKSDELVLGGGGFVLFASAGLVVGYACIAKLVEVIRLHPFHHFFMTRQQLALVGFKSDEFKLAFVCAVVGLAAAGWFLAMSVPIFKGEAGLRQMKFYALVPVLWYCLRAVQQFMAAPINSNDSVSVAAVASCVILANLWFSIAQYGAFSACAKHTRRIAVGSFLALTFSVAFCVPNIAVYVSNGSYTAATTLAADAVSAICGVFVADRILVNSKEKNDVQQKVD